MDHDHYKTWHLDLGHSEFRITVTMAGYGNDLDAAEAFLDGFHRKHPETGPVVSQNTQADSISVTFSVNARDSERAMDLANVVWKSAGPATGLEPGQIVKVETERVDGDCLDESADDREHVPV